MYRTSDHLLLAVMQTDTHTHTSVTVPETRLFLAHATSHEPL